MAALHPSPETIDKRYVDSASAPSVQLCTAPRVISRVTWFSEYSRTEPASVRVVPLLVGLAPTAHFGHRSERT